MTLGSGDANPYIVLPALILFAVSAYRCLYPVRYEHDVVFHASLFSSIFATRLLATFAEVAWIFLFAYVLRLFNLNHVGWVTALSWLMVVQVVISQCFVTTAILTERLELYFYEESGWLLIFTANAIASAYLYLTVGGALGGKEVLLLLSVLFGIAYLPFETAHLASLRAEMKRNPSPAGTASMPILMRLGRGLKRSLMVKKPPHRCGLIGRLRRHHLDVWLLRHPGSDLDLLHRDRAPSALTPDPRRKKLRRSTNQQDG